MDTHSSTTKVRMTLVVDKITHGDEFSFPVDFVPPFLAPRDEPPSEPVDLPAAPASSAPDAALLAAPLGEPMCTVEPLTKKERGVMASIRAMWVWVLGLLAALATFAIDTIASLGLPEWTVFGITLFCTGILYAAKRFVWPDTKF